MRLCPSIYIYIYIFVPNHTQRSKKNGMVYIPYTKENLDIFQDIKVKNGQIWIFSRKSIGRVAIALIHPHPQESSENLYRFAEPRSQSEMDVICRGYVPKNTSKSTKCTLPDSRNQWVLKCAIIFHKSDMPKYSNVLKSLKLCNYFSQNLSCPNIVMLKDWQ